MNRLDILHQSSIIFLLFYMEVSNLPNKIVGCYVRVSTDNQLENYSIEEQIERLKAYCAAKDWNIYNIYTDGGYSGGNINRPALAQMLRDIQDNKIDMVVVYKLDRLSRSQKDTLMLIEDAFLKNQVDFVSISENFDTSTPFGRAMIGILSVFAQLEKDQITERFTMGRLGRAKAGFYHGGSTAPTGYKYINGKLIIDEYKAKQVREVYDRFLKGFSINAISKEMNQKYGGWYAPLVINVLRNSVYTGKVKFNKQEFEGIHEPIITKEIFEKAQILMKKRSKKTESNEKTPFKATNLLTGIVYCKNCGSRYSGVHGYYKCYSRSKTDKKYITDPNCNNKNWKIEILNTIVIQEMRALKYKKRTIDQLFKNKKKELPIDIKALKTRLNELDIQISKMIDLYQYGSIPGEQISKRIASLQKEKESISEQLEHPIEHIEQLKNQFVTSLNLMENTFAGDSLEEKRMLVNSIVRSIFIDGETVNINWKI